jgi:hypothetical protein
MSFGWLPVIGLIFPILSTPVQQAATQPGTPPGVTLPRIAVEDSSEIEVAARLEAAGPLPVPVAVRVQATPGLESDRTLEEKLASYRRLGLAVWLTVPVPTSVEAAEGWREWLAGLLGRHRDTVALLEIAIDRRQAPLGAFAAKLAATEARIVRPGIRLAIGGTLVEDPAAFSSIYTQELAPYVDVIAVSDAAAQAVRDLLETADPDAVLALTGAPDLLEPQTERRELVDVALQDLGTGVAVRAWQASDLIRELRALAPIAPLLKSEITLLDPAATTLRVFIGGRDVTMTHHHRVLFDERTFATYLAYWGEAAAEPLSVSLTLSMASTPVVYDVLRGARTAIADYSRDPATGALRLQVPLTGGPMLIDFNEGAVEMFADRGGVAAERQLSVADIIARHQEQQRAQDSAVRDYSADARMEQHFRPTMADSGYDVVTENRYFVSGRDVEWEELSFSVNGAKWGADRPPFPLLQAEKVLSLPLQLRFDADYRYELSGTESVDGFECYVLRFEPARSGAALYRGTVWIDRVTFARVRVQTVQSGLPAPVVSNEEIQRFMPVATIGDRPVFLFAGLTARQILMVAGRNVLVEKSVTFTNFHVNRPDFDTSRSAARASNRVMYKETDQGLRHYVKEGETRVVSIRPSSSVRAMAMGVTIDPSYGFPLPMFGINYLDFEFGSPDTQLAVLFAGVLAAGNIQRPKLGSTPLDASVDFFAIAVPSSDRLFGPEGERTDQRVLTWPLSSGVNLGWQYTAFQKAQFQYQFRFDAYVRDRTTSEEFVPPPSTITNGLGGAWEYRRGGYSFVTNAAWYRRRSGQDSTYAKYTASLSRDWYFKAVHKVHVNGAWFGGRRLDRFSKYQFGMFDDTRIHGVPASGVRFQDLGMARGSYSFNLLELYRLDLFLEQAWGRDRDVASSWRPMTGLGAAVNVRVPWNMILRADAGKSLLPSGYRGIGSTTLQILLLKPLR